MRLLPTLALLSIVPAGWTQPVPDTTDWRRYFPLEVGNRWQYRADQGQGNIFYFGYLVTGTVVLEGHEYFTLIECSYAEGWPPFCDPDENEVRYSPSAALLLERYVVDGVPGEDRFFLAPCALDAPFQAFGIECEPPGNETYNITGGYGLAYTIGSDTLWEVTVKDFHAKGQPIRTIAVADVGAVYQLTDKGTYSRLDLAYVRVGEAEYGEPAFVFPSASEPKPPSTAFALAVRPNPARDGEARVVLTLGAAQAVRVEAFDALGRRVSILHDGSLAGGQHAISLDSARLGPGVYLVRASGAGFSVTRPLTIVR
ncbi:MAG TPA: T9SS type A sorting domain-containing protein [Rubricoccaceae bacterium]|nr:T9SS type A sorting domain-containing protein [Rubricoccaceae bacterium]